MTRRLYVPRPPWVRHAACTEAPLRLFFPPTEHDAAYDAGRTICATCVVRLACLEEAMGRPEVHGLWGGLTPRERRRLARQRRRTEAAAS